MSLEIESRGLFEDLIAQPLAVALLEACLLYTSDAADE